MKIIMAGNVGGKHPVESGTPKPMHVVKFDELVILADHYEAYNEYAESVGSTQTANNAWVAAARLKRRVDKLYKRWRKG